MLSLRTLLEEMSEKDASDLHLSAGLPPMLRIDGSLVAASHDPLNAEETRSLALDVSILLRTIGAVLSRRGAF